MVTASELLGVLNTDATEVLDVLAAASLVIDDTDQVIRATPGAISFGLVQNGELVHKPLRDLVDQARAERKTVIADLNLQTGLRGQRSYVHARAAKLGRTNVLLLVEDRTEAKRVEDTRRDFVENISHELKTPIGAISLLAEAIEDAANDPEMVAKFAKNLKRESKRLGSLVKDIIQLSQYQSADSPTQFELLEMSDMIAEAVEQNQFLADKKRVKISVSAPAGTQVYGDRESLTAAIKNLIENAVIYSEDGAQVGIGLREIGDVVELSVLDNGIGISVVDQERIFERFYRADPSRSRETGGTGLGLAIVKHIANNHRGEITVFSQLGLGSTFTLRLPKPDTSVTEVESETK